MSIWDDRILEWMRENEESGTPKQIHESGNFRISQTQVGRRMKKLAEHGLLKHIGNGAYVLTDEAGAYLNEQYDAETGRYVKNDDSTDASADDTTEA